MEMVGTVKSNAFRVRDAKAFRTWLEGYRFGSEVEVIEYSDETEGNGTRLCLYGSELYPSAHPKLAYDEDDDSPEEIDADLPDFAAQMRTHLCEGETFYMLACGAEGQRFAGYEELAIDASGEAFRCASSDCVEDAKRLIAERKAQ